MGSIGKLLAQILAALTGGSGGPGGPVTVANGADVAEGATTDAAVSTDANGTVNGHIRGLVVLLVNLLSRWPAALGQGMMAQSSKVVIASDQTVVPITPIGATTVASAQVTGTSGATTLAAARPTRRQITFKNIDTSNTVWIGPATVTALNGMQLLAGQSITLTSVILWQIIAPAGSPIVCVTDEYY